MADNIQARMDSGDEPLVAAYNGATRCTIPNLSATTAIIVAFAPLLAVPGAVGQFLHALPWVVIVSVATSYFVAMFVVPSAMVVFPKGIKEPHRFEESPIRSFFQKLLKIGLQHKKQTVFCTIAALILVLVFVMPRLTSQFFPYVDKDIFYIQLNSEKTGDMKATEKLVDDVAELVKKEPEVTACVESVGDGVPKFYITMASPTPADDYAMVVVKYNLDKSHRFKSNVELASYLQSLLNENISGGQCKVKLLETG